MMRKCPSFTRCRNVMNNKKLSDIAGLYSSNATSNILAYLLLGQQNFDIKTLSAALPLFWDPTP